MRDEKISDFLAQLADRVPAPGGGAAAALHAARPPSPLPLSGRTPPAEVITAATEAARAAATTARVNVEINLGGITDERARAELATEAAPAARAFTQTCARWSGSP